MKFSELNALWVGASIGVLVAFEPLFLDAYVSDRQVDFIANIDGVLIQREDVELAEKIIAADRNGPLSPADRQLALRRVLQEEILIQEAIERDLIRQDEVLRREATITMLEAGSRWFSDNRIEGVDRYLNWLHSDNSVITLEENLSE